MKDTPDSEESPFPPDPVPEASNTDDAARLQLNQLLKRVAAGDQAAFSEMYRLTASHLFGVVIRMMRDQGEAEDLLQEIFTTVWRRADTFDPTRGSAMAWLITMARNRTIDRMRQHREEALDDDQALAIPDDAPSPAMHAEASQERIRLERCLAKLEPAQDRVVREAFFSGASYSELAARLSVPLGTMKSWIRRSLIQLKTCLEQ